MSIPESHLAQEAIAALVDGELAAGPAGRAARHLTGCAQCRMAVQAQREAKEALHDCPDVTVPGDLMSRLCAIPFTTDVPGTGAGGTLSAGPRELTLSGSDGSWSVDLAPRSRGPRGGSGRWLRRGLTGTLVGLGVGVSALAVTLPTEEAPGRAPSGPVAGPSVPDEHTEVVPPVVRTVTVGTTGTGTGAGLGGTP
jgi:hypothetical protein